MQKNTFLFGSATLIIMSLVTVLFAEIILRLAGFHSPLTYEPVSEYGWKHFANHHFTRVTESSTIEISTNSMGLRDTEHKLDDKINPTKFLFLGDSFTEALQVPFNKTFVKLFESLHSTQSSNNIETINSGMSGFGTDNALLYYINEGKKYRSKHIVLMFYIGNDIRNNWYKLENIDTGGFRKPYYSLNSSNQLVHNINPNDQTTKLISRVKLALNKHSRLYAFVRVMRDSFRHENNSGESKIPFDFNIYKTTQEQEWEQAWKITGKLLQKLNVLIKQENAELLVTIIPSQEQVHQKYWKQAIPQHNKKDLYKWDVTLPTRKLISILKTNKINHLDLLPIFTEAAKRSSEELYLPIDAHWNEKGHMLAAQALSAYYIDR